MPELPEVETTVRLLKQKVLEKTFVCVWSEKEDTSLNNLIEKQIIDIERVGKGIFFHLSDSNFLFIHLKMTGHLLLGRWKKNVCRETKKEVWRSSQKIMQDKKNGYLRYVFFLNNGKQLALSDPRKFARVEYFNNKDKQAYESKIGIDALKISKEDFFDIFENKKGSVKTILMDQSIIAGVGNIYASEALHIAGVNPKKKGGLLTKRERDRIYKSMRDVLNKGLKLSGDSTSDFRLLDGGKGGYQNCHLVYNRQGEQCFTCKALVKRIVVGGRGTYYCSRCQQM